MTKVLDRYDFDFNFQPHPLTGDLAMKRGLSAIIQSLKNIVLTSFYERGFNVAFGTNVRSSLFELYSPLDLLTMKDFVTEAIENYEPNVELVDVLVNESGDNALTVSIQYSVFGETDEETLNLQLTRLR